MRALLVFLCGGLSATAVVAQSSGHLGVFLEVLPPVLRVTVTSARVDFGLQHANAGSIVLDPTTGEISGKAAGPHQMGQLQVTGRTGSAYAVAVATSPFLQGRRGQVDFGLRWAHSADCSNSPYESIIGPQMVTGLLGQSGCSALRFGGALQLEGIPEGRYEGHLHVRIVAL